MELRFLLINICVIVLTVTAVLTGVLINKKLCKSSSKINKPKTTQTSDADRWISLHSECEKRGLTVQANTSIFDMVEMIKTHDEMDS